MYKLVVSVLAVLVSANYAHAQIGWTLDQCWKHWGLESSVEHPYLDESHTTTSIDYIFGSDSKIEKQVSFDQQRKVNDVWYFTRFEDNNYDENIDAENLRVVSKGERGCLGS
jgi:hypothetical protein